MVVGMSESKKTLAMKFLDGKKVKYAAHSYSAELKDAEQVAEAVGFVADEVYKTLVVMPPEPRAKPLLMMVPANMQLDLKKVAKTVGAKKVKMATQRDAEQLTGLQVGGISALALTNKRFGVYIAEQAKALDRIVVSAGERGQQIELAVADLVRLTNARYGDIAS